MSDSNSELLAYIEDDGIRFELGGKLKLDELGYVPACYHVDTLVHIEDGDEIEFWIVAPVSFELFPMDILIASELAKIWLSANVK